MLGVGGKAMQHFLFQAQLVFVHHMKNNICSTLHVTAFVIVPE